MDNTTKIEQVDPSYNNKLGAVLKLTKTVEQVRTVTFMGMISDLAATVNQIRDLEARKEETIDLLASVSAAQGYTAEEMAVIKSQVLLDEETKTALLLELAERAGIKESEGSVNVVGEIATESIIPAVEEAPTAPIDETATTVE